MSSSLTLSVSQNTHQIRILLFFGVVFFIKARQNTVQMFGISCTFYAAIWHWYFLLCIYILFLIFIASVHSFFILFFNLNCPRYQRVLASCAFLTGTIPKGLILRKKNSLMFVYVFCTFVSGLNLLFLDNLWFDYLRAGKKNRRQIEHCF